MNVYDFSGEVAVITGGAQGIGLATARRMIEGGAQVRLWDIDAAMLEKAKAALGDACSIDRVDITDPAACQAAASAAVADLGKLSVLVNSAGIAGLNDPVEVYPEEEWLRIINLNLNGTFYTNKAVIPHMKANGYGRIVNVAARPALEPRTGSGMVAYTASKAAVAAMTAALGEELKGDNILVNAIAPSILDTPANRNDMPKANSAKWVSLEAAAELIAFLVSPRNAATSSAVIPLYAGA